MLIKPFHKSIDDVDDIDNIFDKHRYIFIYTYDYPFYPLALKDYKEKGYYYDIYLINDSQVIGKNFMIPQKTHLYNRNCYRAFSRDVLDEKGQINYQSELIFYEGNFLNRIESPDDEPINISYPQILSNLGPCGYDDMIMYKLKSEWIQPYPKYYNVEHQARLLTDDVLNKMDTGDFMLDSYEVRPLYKLGELIDSHTKIAIIHISGIENIIQTEMAYDDKFSNAALSRFNNGNVKDIGILKARITDIFIKLQYCVMSSIFSSVDFIIDFESGDFGIPRESIRCKFGNIQKDRLVKEYAKLIYDTSKEIEAIDSCNLDVPNDVYLSNMYPTKAIIRISNTFSYIKLINTYEKIINYKTHKSDFLSTSGKVSSSDGDEMMQMFYAEGNW